MKSKAGRQRAPLDAGSVISDLQQALHTGPSAATVKAGVRRVVAQAGVARDQALPCEADVLRFLKRLGWIPPHAQRRQVQKAYTDFIAEAAQRRGIDPLATSLYLRIHAAAGAMDGVAPICGETPACAQCACVGYCAYATRSGETADELHRRQQALEAGRGEELADEDLLAILWAGATAAPDDVTAARQLLASADPGQDGTGEDGPPRDLGVTALEALAAGHPGPVAASGDGLRGLLAIDPLELRRRLGRSGAGSRPDARLRLMAGAEICRRWARSQVQTGRQILKATDLFDLFHLLLRDQARENFYVGLLDNKHRLFQALRVSEGTLNTAPIHPREVFAPAVRAQANAVVFVHNHPSGDPAPSREDFAVTRRLGEAAELLGIRILDHVIIGDGRYYSFAESGKL